MKARLFTLVYGRHLDLFAKACVPALCWPRALGALRQHAIGWSIYCEDQDRERLRRLCEPLGIPLDLLRFDHFETVGLTLHRCLQACVVACLRERSALLLLPPDTVLGDGSLESMFRVARPPGVCVSVCHVRVDAAVAERSWVKPISNPALVDIAFASLHPSWEHADVTQPHNNSRASGVSWQKVCDGLWLAQHRLPTPYLSNLTPDDVRWLRSREAGGIWDHEWPALLVEAQRQRFLGSSDAAFAIELTGMHENIPDLDPINLTEPDEYHKDLAHHRVNRNTVVVLRGEHG